MRKRTLILILATIIVSLMSINLIVNAQSADQPKVGGTITIAWPRDPISMNTILNFWYSSETFQVHLYGRLLTYSPEWEIEPDLAETWDILDGGKTHVFHLRDNIMWSDGVPFTSADVEWHFWNVANGWPAPCIMTGKMIDLVDIETPDDQTVIFKYSKPTTINRYTYTQSGNLILPKHIYEGDDEEEFKNNPNNWMPVSNGPFKIVEYEKDQYIRMVRNDLYWGRPSYLDEIIWKVMPDAETVKLALQTGDVTYWQYPSGNDFEYFDTIDHLKYTYFPATRLVGYQFNANASAIAKWPWLGDVNVRRAFAHAVDTPALIDQAWGGVAYEGHTWVPVGYTGFFNEEANARYPAYDPVEAERLLDEAGYPRGSDGWRDIEFDYLGDGDVAELLKYYWGEVGIKATIWAVEYATSVQKYMYGGYGDEVAVGGLGTGMGPDGDITVNLYGNRSIGNINSVYYDNARVNELLDLLSETVIQADREEILMEIQDETMDDFQTVILLTDTRRWVWNDDLFGGFDDHPKPVYVIEPFGYYGFSREGEPLATATVTATATGTTTTVTVTETGGTTTGTETIAGSGGMSTTTVGLIAILAIALGAGVGYFLTRPK
ncbi:hypothetical protein KAR91_82185 [Candidatus Pacearchaeota archaeon]|nr:hypothetical protein [Candidatus Pacearchaeota archaeon]